MFCGYVLHKHNIIMNMHGECLQHRIKSSPEHSHRFPLGTPGQIGSTSCSTVLCRSNITTHIQKYNIQYNIRCSKIIKSTNKTNNNSCRSWSAGQMTVKGCSAVIYLCLWVMLQICCYSFSSAIRIQINVQILFSKRYGQHFYGCSSD